MLLDQEAQRDNVLVSSISFWEIALLVKKGRIGIDNLDEWKNDILKYSGARLAYPEIDDMIASTRLPDHHKDPFDRLLVCQANREKAALVSRDSLLSAYEVELIWGP